MSQVLIQSKTLKASDSQFKSAVSDVSQRLHRVEGVSTSTTPMTRPAQVSKDGHSALVQFNLKGDQRGREEDGGELTGRRQRCRQGAS